MTAEAGGWVRFEIEPDLTRGANTVRLRAVVTTTAQGFQPKPCAAITMAARSGREARTVALTDRAVGELTLVLGRKPYAGSDLTVTIHQSEDGPAETFVVRHVPGQPLTGGCRLLPILSDLDAWRYLASNPGVVETTGLNLDAARRHFHEVGFYEGLLITFDPLRYLASHPDLEACGDSEECACEHYVTFGHREGRTITFDPQRYLDRHADIAAATAGDVREAALHYLRCGRREGRSDR